MSRPFNLNVSQADLEAANRWWSNLSNNQMKGYRDRFAPNSDWYRLGQRTIHQIWEDEGKPDPQPTIPV
jgi:hypothetical protein